MTFAEFVVYWAESCRNSNMRQGQELMHCLGVLRDDLYRGLAQSELDPFYIETRLPAALEWIASHWDAVKGQDMKQIQFIVRVYDPANEEAGYRVMDSNAMLTNEETVMLASKIMNMVDHTLESRKHRDEVKASEVEDDCSCCCCTFTCND